MLSRQEFVKRVNMEKADLERLRHLPAKERVGTRRALLEAV
jgi:hypothetical protein